MRLHDVEELRDHRAHAAEVPRARGAAQRVGERLHDHEGVVGRGVHVVHFRVEDDVDAVALADARIAFEIARVGLVVLARPELDGVDEYRDDDSVARRAGGVHEALVALVQRPHGGHKPDGEPLGLPGGRPGLHVRNGANDLHGRPPRGFPARPQERRRCARRRGTCRPSQRRRRRDRHPA